jgi:hypothetical protein
MIIRVECPHCGYLLSTFEEKALIGNKVLRRAYMHCLKNPILCAGCKAWIQRPKVYRGTDYELSTPGGRSTSG